MLPLDLSLSFDFAPNFCYALICQANTGEDCLRRFLHPSKTKHKNKKRNAKDAAHAHKIYDIPMRRRVAVGNGVISISWNNSLALVGVQYIGLGAQPGNPIPSFMHSSPAWFSFLSIFDVPENHLQNARAFTIIAVSASVLRRHWTGKSNSSFPIY